MKILTLNLRHHQDRWEERLPLVVDVLRTHQPDIVGFQEVWIPIQQAHLILNQLSDVDARMHLQVAPKQGEHAQEGIALASRYPIISHEILKLPGGERVAQRALIDVSGTQIWVANTHLHHRPVDESVRLPQMQALLSWLDEVPDPIILTGDMNAQPTSATILTAKTRFQSAYEEKHGAEASATFPTPLVKESDLIPVVIDYIFFSSDSLEVRDAMIVANISDPNDMTLYPSDHYGILANIEFNQH